MRFVVIHEIAFPIERLDYRALARWALRRSRLDHAEIRMGDPRGDWAATGEYLLVETDAGRPGKYP